MKKVLWVLNKHCGLEKTEMFFPDFLTNFQRELITHNIELSFVFFSENLINIDVQNKCIYEKERYNNLSRDDLKIQAEKIEKEYSFTFKQALFPDIIQTFDSQNGMRIVVPEKQFNDLNFMIPKFLYLEKLIKENDFDIIFSDVSPEYEMEFGRIIGNKLNKVVLKEYLGAALGNTVIIKCNKFGEFKWIEAQGDQKFDLKSTKAFTEIFLNFKKDPYKKYFTSSPKSSILKKIIDNNLGYLFSLPLSFLRYLKNKFMFLMSRLSKKMFLYKKLDETENFLFFGFHLLTESTVTYKSLPYTNQKMLIEMISRVLPFNHFLYVREHPHWPDKYSYRFLKSISSLPNVKILSPELSIHKILSKTKGVVTLTSTTGIEALIHGKPVLSFSDNIYQGYHSSAIKCVNLFDLGSKLVELINTRVNEKETINYINRLRNNSVSVCLGSYNFYSKADSMQKAKIFSSYLNDCIQNEENDEKNT